MLPPADAGKEKDEKMSEGLNLNVEEIFASKVFTFGIIHIGFSH